jgi:hypothetical protein
MTVTARFGVMEDGNGQLVCQFSNHTPAPGDRWWCVDIEDYVRAGKDAETVYQQTQLVVPVFPRHNLWATVNLDDKEIAGSRRLLVPTRTGGNFVSGTDVVGLVSQGDGRWVIRNMLIDWAFPKYRTKHRTSTGQLVTTGSIECESRSHSLAAERYLKALTDNNAKQDVVASMWSTVYEGLCLYCLQKSHDALNDHDADSTGLDF